MLTEKQQRVYDFLRESMQNAIPPSVREICNATGIKSTSTVHGILNVLKEKGLIEKDAQNARSVQIAGTARTVQVPLLGTVQAGLPVLAVEQIEEYIPFSIQYAGSGKELFALHVRGESMKNAAILDGDIVVCEKTPVAEEGEIVVALLEDEATVKRFYREGYGFRLQPENDDFDPIYASEITILGKVIACIRHYC